MLPSQTCFIVLTCFGFWNTRLIRGCGTCSKSKALAAQSRAAWALADFYVFGSHCRKRTLFLAGNMDGRDLHRITRTCGGTGGRCSVSGRPLFLVVMLTLQCFKTKTWSSKHFRITLHKIRQNQSSGGRLPLRDKLETLAQRKRWETRENLRIYTLPWIGQREPSRG